MRVRSAVIVFVLLAGCASPTPSSTAVVGLGPASGLRDDSLTVLGPRRAALAPVSRIRDDRIDECSGLAFAGGYWWTHNDSGGDPALYRGTTPEFAASVKFEIPRAKAVDWEELAVLDGDVLVCDVGDNRRERDDLAIYRVRPTEDGITLAATYPVAYPDGAKHDCEGVFVVDGRVHLIVKNRGEDETTVYAFGALADGALNVALPVGALELPKGERVTAAARVNDDWVGVLTYAQLLLWPADRVDGAPHRAFRLHARQCEALAFADGAAHFTNEQRDVYRVDDILECALWVWETPRAEFDLVRAPRVPYGFPPNSTLGDVPLLDAQPGESLRVALSGEDLVLSGSMRFTGEFRATDEPAGRLGTAAWFAFGTRDSVTLDASHIVLAISADADGKLLVVPLDMIQGGDPDLSGARVEGSVVGNVMTFRASVPVARAFPEGMSEQFLFQAIYQGRARGEQDTRVGGLDLFSIFRPYTWGVVAVPR